MEINIENNNLELEFGTSSVDFKTGTQTIYEKDHSKLENLDYENSGHTGFQPAGDYALKTDIPDVSNLATKDEIPDVSGFATKEEIPDKTSQLKNDSGFLTEHQNLSGYAKKTDIPDVSNFITKDVSDLTNYYDKNSIDEILGNIEDFLGGI